MGSFKPEEVFTPSAEILIWSGYDIMASQHSAFRSHGVTFFSPCTSTQDSVRCLVEVEGEKKTMPVQRVELPQGSLDLLISGRLAETDGCCCTSS